MSAILTIAIPTFKRNKAFAHLLGVLSEFVDSSVQILVLDNDGSSGKDKLIQSLGLHSKCELTYINWPTNIGANENILRCLEFSSGRYVWILGDDDVPSKSSLDIIRTSIMSYPSASFFNFYLPDACHTLRTNTKSIHSKLDYLQSTKTLGDLLFISNHVFRRDLSLTSLTLGYQWQISVAPMLILGLYSISHEHPAVLSNQSIVDSKQSDTVHSSILKIAASLTTLELLPLDSKEHTALIKLRLWYSPLTILRHTLSLAASNSVDRHYLRRLTRRIALGTTSPPFNIFSRLSILTITSLLSSRIGFKFCAKFVSKNAILNRLLLINVDMSR